MAKRRPRNNATSSAQSLPTCGIVMPISKTVGYPDGHWRDVLAILVEAARNAGYQARLVSESDETRVIQDSIVKNLYRDEIVIVDVSAKNPNVLFELGMRLTFDKPVVIVKDNRTDYVFDVGNISTLTYPAELRYQEINDFQSAVCERLKATAKHSKEPGHSSFLKQFSIVDYNPSIDIRQGGKEDLILDAVKSLQKQVTSLNESRRARREFDQKQLFFADVSEAAASIYRNPQALGSVLSPWLKKIDTEKLPSYKDFLRQMTAILQRDFGVPQRSIKVCRDVLPEMLFLDYPHLYEAYKSEIEDECAI